jgi:hypothetical protein
MIVTPTAATGALWDRWRDIAKIRRPIRYLIQQDFTSALNVSTKRAHEIIWWVRYRTTNRNHVLKVRTLKPGYFDASNTMLHMAFEILCRFVQNEFPMVHNTQQKKGLLYSMLPFLSRVPRGHIAGLHALDDYLNDDDVKNHWQTYERYTAIRDLYVWWMVERPNRLDCWTDPMIWKNMSDVERDSFSFGAPISQAWRDAHDKSSSLDAFYSMQDNEMLKNLIEIRGDLWT